MQPLLIRAYRPADEQGWLRCRFLAFLDSAYYDDVHREKERYPGWAIELVAEIEGQIVGLIDVECEEVPGSVCSSSPRDGPGGRAGMIWHLAVHPDYRRRGIAAALLREAQARARGWQLERFEAWTRDDAGVEAWYRAQGFRWVEAYQHVYMSTREEVDSAIRCDIPGLRPVSVFAHYTGDDETVCRRFGRVHRCSRYDLDLEA
jgi:ribosomal protein S18 acetylase RimI-like enzyme